MLWNLKRRKKTPNKKDRGYLITGKAPLSTLGIFFLLYRGDTKAMELWAAVPEGRL